MRLSRKDFVSARVFGGRKGGEDSSCAYVDKRPMTYNFDRFDGER